MRTMSAVTLLPVLACLPDLPDADIDSEVPLDEDTGVVRDSGDTGDSSVPPLVLQSVSAGGQFTCGLTFDQEVVCWGHEGEGQQASPYPSLQTVSVGFNYSCGLDFSNNIVCWGGVFSDEKAVNDIEFPTLEEDEGEYSEIELGKEHGCAVSTGRKLRCWDGSYSVNALMDDQPMNGIIAVSTSGYHACAIRTSGSPECWGYAGKVDEIGKLKWDAVSIPEDVESLSAIGTGRYHTCGIEESQDQVIRCWGQDHSGQVSEAPDGEFEQLAVGDFHNCALDLSGEMSCWGRNDYGQATAPPGSFLAVSAGLDHTCALNTEHEVECWGNDALGQTLVPSGAE